MYRIAVTSLSKQWMLNVCSLSKFLVIISRSLAIYKTDDLNIKIKKCVNGIVTFGKYILARFSDIKYFNNINGRKKTTLFIF